MKKILTLLVMFLATASILTAQTSKLSYQMIVRNQTSNVVTGHVDFQPNDLVYNQTVNVVFAILQGADTVYKCEKMDSTNMNGMLSFVLTDPTTTDGTFSADSRKLTEIEWGKSKTVVQVSVNSTVLFKDEREILPVPYALEVTKRDSSITTPKIIEYIDNVATGADAKSIVDAIYGNNKFLLAMRDTILSTIKRHPDLMKELAIYYISKVDTSDVRKANEAVDSVTKAFLIDKIVEHAKAKKATAYEILGEYLRTTTTDDVKKMIEAAESNENAKVIIKMLADSAIQYIDQHKDVLEDAVKSIVSHTTTDGINAAQDWLKQNNPGVYNAGLVILDTLIEQHLRADSILSGKCGDTIIRTLCDLQAQIDQLRNAGFTVCPTFKEPNTIYGYKVISAIDQNVNDVNLDTNAYYYELTFPGTTYDPVLLPVDFLYNVHVGSKNDSVDKYPKGYITANLSDWQHKNVVFRPKMKLLCMDTATFGKRDTIYCGDCECPEFASFDVTGTSSAELKANHGVALTAKLTSNYNKVTERGFVINHNGVDTVFSTKGGGNIIINSDNLTYSDTIFMDFCGEYITVYPYALCDGQNDTIKPEPKSFQLREMNLNITPTNGSYILDGTPVKLVATNSIKISTQSYINTLGTSTPSIEKIITKYGADYGVNTTPTYSWQCAQNVDPNMQGQNTDTLYATPMKAIAYDSVTYYATCSFEMFNHTCTLTDSVKVFRDLTCGDTMRYQGDLYGTIQIGTQCWTRNNMRAKETSTGAPIDLNEQAATDTATNGKLYYFKTSPLLKTRYDSTQLGLLYNLAAAKVVCPNGWELPSDAAWTVLETFVDSNNIDQNHRAQFTDNAHCYARRLDLATGDKWTKDMDGVTPWKNANNIGFDAYPAGARHINALLPEEDSRDLAVFWTSTEGTTATNQSGAYVRVMQGFANEPQVKRQVARHEQGFSVRCVKKANN